MREVSCAGYTLCAWDPRSLQPMLDGPLYFDAKWLNGRSVAIDRPLCSLQRSNLRSHQGATVGNEVLTVRVCV